MPRLTDSEIDAFEEFEHRMEMAEHAAIVAKLMKLNKADLFTLARHYKIPYYTDYAEAWARDGKAELASEIAYKMRD